MMLAITEFIESRGITMHAHLAMSNPNITEDDWADGTRHWTCVLHRGPNKLQVFFSQGPALTADPTPQEVLDCLASDSAGVDNCRGFDDWAGDYGYDTDSRKAERAYGVVSHQAQQLRDFLGQDDFDALLWETERE